MAPVVIAFLKPYQKLRILTFFNPERDPLGAGYQLIQSKIAIGSGGFTGKGFFKRQSKLSRLFTRKTYRFHFHFIFRRIWIFGLCKLIDNLWAYYSKNHSYWKPIQK